MKKIMNIIDEQNNKGRYEIFCSFDSNMTNKSYVLFTDHCVDEEGKLIIQAGRYSLIDDDTIKVDKNLIQEEYDMIANVMKGLIDKANK